MESDPSNRKRVWGEMGTHVELIILGGLNGSVFGKALDDLDGLFELGLGHDE